MACMALSCMYQAHHELKRILLIFVINVVISNIKITIASCGGRTASLLFAVCAVKLV